MTDQPARTADLPIDATGRPWRYAGTSIDTRPETVEYGIAERRIDRDQPLYRADLGSWYSDRYYTNDLMGREAAEAAIARVLDDLGDPDGDVFEVIELRRFTRAPGL